MRKSCKIGLALLLTPVFLLLLSLFVVIGFISTTSGSSFIVSKVNSLLEGTLSITLDLKEGSLVYGPVTDKPFEVLVNDVVRVSSDTLDLRYNAWDLLFKGSLFIDKLKADNLKVELILPDDDTESEEDSEETVEDEEPFRLVFPFPVKLKTLEVDTFAYLSDIIDIQVDNIRANLEIRDSFASVNTLSTDNVLVHLKDDDWEDEEETASDTAAAIENVAALDLKKLAGKVTAEGKETAAAASAVTGADTKATSENSHSRAFISRAREGVNSVIDSLIEGLKEIISDTLGVLGFNGGEHGEIERLVTVDLPLDANIGELKAGKVRYYMSNYDTGEISDVEVSAFWNHTLLSVGKVRASHPLGKVAVKGSMNFDEYFTLNFDVSGEGECSEYTKTEYEGALYGLKGSAAVTGSLVDLNLNARITEPQEILVRGRLNCLSSALPSELEVSTRKLVYPFKNAFEDSEKTQLEADAQPESVSEDNWQATADRALNENSSIEDSDKVKAFAISSEQEKITLSDFSLKSEGPIMGDMKVRLEGRLEGYGLENARVELDCKVSLARALINKLSVDGSYQGAPFNVAYRGLTDYSSDVLLDGRLAASASDLEDLNDLLSGKGELLTDFLFRYQLESDNIQFKVRSIDGNLILNGKQLLLTGRDLVGDLAQGYNLGSFRVTQGRNLVDLHGMVGEKSDLVGNLSLKALEDLAPGLKGNLIGRVRARNSITSPDLSMLIRSKGLLRYEDMMASDLSVNASLSASEGRIGVTVVSEYLKLAKGLKPSRKCALDLSGTLAKHRLSLNCGGNNGGYIGAEGSYSEQDKIWQGSLKDLIFVSQYTDPVSLKDKVEINIDTENMSGSLSAFEIGGEMGSLQVGKTEFGSGRISTTVDLPNLDISKLTRYLPNAVMRGSASLHADIDMIDGVPDIKAQVQANRNFFSMASFALGIDKALVEASFTGSQIKTHTAVDLFRNRGRLEADINLSDPYEARKLSGNIDLTELDLGLFQALGNAFNELKGTASVHGSLGGDLSMPLFNGTVSAKGSAEPSVGIGKVENFDFSLKAQGSSGVIDGTLEANESTLRLTGNLDWRDGARGDINVDSEDLYLFLAGYGDAHSIIHLKASLQDHMEVSGTVDIPKANIIVSKLDSGVITPSKDQIVVGERGAYESIKENEAAAAPVDSRIAVKIALGDAVKLNAMGLKANVVGGLDVSKEIGGEVIRGDGKISLEQGSADLFGHKFFVSFADTIFNGNIANPKISAEVIADPAGLDDDVTVGVKVRGEATDPEIELFSNPVMSQNEILSYILYGHGLEETSSGSSSDSSAQLLIALGVGSTAGLVNSITGALGMNQVQFGSTGTGDDTQVGVQSYITRDIRISYGYGVFTSVGEFRLRYELVRKLYLEFISSVDQAVDLVYSFEIN